MNANDTAAVLGILSAAWPNQTITAETATVWRDILADIDSADAMHAARTLVKREHWFPSLAQFRSEAEAHAHARRNKRAASHGLPASPPPAAADGHRRLVDAARQVLAAQRGQRHWHGGPQPCPICGGLAPKAAEVATVTRPDRPRTGQPLNGCGLTSCQTCYGTQDAP